MTRSINIRLTDDLFRWLKNRSRITGLPMARIVREQLDEVKFKEGKQRFLRHLAAVKGGPGDVSSRKGYSRRQRHGARIPPYKNSMPHVGFALPGL